MSYSQEINSQRVEYDAYSVASATTTGVIDLKGGTLVGVYAGADLTSTTFTLTMSPTEEGTYVTVKDPLASGAAITYTIGSTATGYFPISETTTKESDSVK